jgi:hypothetical protein
MKTNRLLAKGKNLLLGALSLGALAATSSCGGEVSFFEVNVSMSGITSACAYTIASCEVTVSGAATDHFSLEPAICDQRATVDRGRFQFGTEAGSGDVNFHIEVFNGNRDKLGAGDASKPIMKGGRVVLDLVAMIDQAALASTMACAKQ